MISRPQFLYPNFLQELGKRFAARVDNRANEGSAQNNFGLLSQ
jgi:hypothetical protein